jgi:hypothetical protein
MTNQNNKGNLDPNSPVTPVAVYSNAESSKSQIIKDNKGKSGVYR